MRFLKAVCLLLPLALSLSAAPQGPKGRRAGQAVRREYQSLNLSEDQKKQITPLLKQEAEQMKALRADQSLNQTQMRERARQLHSDYDAKIQPLLTAEQQQKLADDRAARREQLKQARGKRAGRRAPPQQ